MLHVPDDCDLLAAVGVVALRHAHLDHILRMTVKSLSGVTVREALDETSRAGSRQLRTRIKKLAKGKLSEGAAMLQLDALLERCRKATEERNRLIHDIWASELDGDPKIMNSDHTWGPIPSIGELEALSSQLVQLTLELNLARLEGFLHLALESNRDASVTEQERNLSQ